MTTLIIYYNSIIYNDTFGISDQMNGSLISVTLV